MAKKTLKKKEVAYSFLDEVKKRLPSMLTHAASLQPFDDVINSQWVDTDHVGIGIDSGTAMYPSGVYQTYGALIYADRVIMFCDSDYAEHMREADTPGPAREEYVTDMAGLWAYLRQIPRPMHSFGQWYGGQ